MNEYKEGDLLFIPPSVFGMDTHRNGRFIFGEDLLLTVYECDGV